MSAASLLRRGCVAGLASAAFAARAAVGLMELPAAGSDGPVTVFYPTAAEERGVVHGPFTLPLAEGAAPARGNGRLVVVSHGSGGNPWVHANLARALVAEGFVVAFPQHHGDNASDPSQPGPQSWKLRPGEVSRAIDAVGRDAQLAPLLALDKVGLYGMSAGGHTALTLATAAGDKWLAPRFHSGPVLQACLPRCELLADLPTGGHGALLSPPPPRERLDTIAADLLADLLADPTGFDRAQLPALDRRIAAFFRAHLLP